MKHYQNWIFDWSGTLADDMALVVDATNHVMRQYGVVDFTKETFRESFYLPYGEWYAEILPGVDLDEIEQHFRKGFDTSDAGVPMLPFAVELLEKLTKSGKRVFACTSMDPTAFIEQSEGHGVASHFEECYSGVQDKRNLIKDLLSSNALEKSETVFVGDMIHDIDTANHGGIDSIAVLTGYNTAKELNTMSPTYLLDSLEPLLD